ncbi:MAG: gluconate 2-dehydrogenase subunit 3 family protein [Acidobacteria bacterium]|nr:gluconate 2-dehydrogenase subunit 3 family protein [Acidobacteriota bacterium]
MSIDRREAIRMLTGVATALAVTPAEASVLRKLVATRQMAEPQFFTADEFRLVTMLADMILPADERSGSASDVGVPEFIDFMVIDRPDGQVPMRGGLAWLDLEAGERFGRVFAECAGSEREAILDDISWAGSAPAELSHGVVFFNAFRDLTATGFWTSKEGIEDLQYLGNRYRNAWRGCPPEQLRHLGIDPETIE